MDITGAADLATNKSARGKGFAVVAAVEGTCSVLVSVGAGRGDAVDVAGPSRGNVVLPGGGRGSAGVPDSRSNAIVSSSNIAESSVAASRENLQPGGSASGYTTGPAGNSCSRGLEVPLPEPTPKIGRANDIRNIWCHGKSLLGNGWTCGYCDTTTHGGGATRFKEHVAGIAGGCQSCMNAPHHVVRVFREVIPTGKDKRKKRKEIKRRVQEAVNHGNNSSTPIPVSDDEFEGRVQRAVQASLKDAQYGAGGSNAAGCSGVSGSNAAGRTQGDKGYFDVELAYTR